MNNSAIKGAFESMAKLIRKNREIESLHHKLVKGIAQQHMKDNKVKHTVAEANAMYGALEYMLFGSNRYEDGNKFTSRQNWPTHIRLCDLKPVRVRFGKVEDMGGAETYTVVGLVDSVKIERGFVGDDHFDKAYITIKKDK